MNCRGTWIAVVFVGMLACAPALAQQFGHETTVIDEVGVINQATQKAVDRCLLELEQKTAAQVRVLVINSTKGRDIHDYAIEVAKKQKDRAGQSKTGLGRAGKDNGVLIVVAVKDRRYRFEVGEGLEGTLPDLYCDSIAQKYFVPNFRRGDYGKGIYEGTVAVARKIAADAGVRIEGMPTRPVEKTEHGQPVGGGGIELGGCCCVPLVPLLFLIIIFSILSSRRHGYCRTWSGGFGGGGFWQGMLLGQLLGGGWGGHSRGGWGGGSSWGGGFGGGGFGGGGFGGGGFSGGGGGSFGGGGASGGW